MFLRFGVENHGSIRHYAQLSWVSTPQHDEPSWRLPATAAPHGVLPVLAVYGANASGKSNLVNALLLFRDHIARSFIELAPDAKVPWAPWRGGVDAAEPTRVDADILVEGTRYHYGFRWDESGFREEWLFSWPHGRRQILFHRDHSQADPWYFGPELGGQRAEIRRATRSNALFLSAAAQYDHQRLRPIWDVLAGVRREAPVQLHGHPVFPPGAAVLAERNREVVLAALRAADLGVVDFRSVVNEPQNELVGKVLSGLLGADRAESVSRPVSEHREIWLTHADADGATWEHEPDLESRGTHILLTRMNDVLSHLASAQLMVVDEIETSLHPELCGALVDLFTDASTNPKGAQLLFTTHNRGLLSRLRRDEVVLLDKASDGGTVVRAASDFKGLRGRDDLRRAYGEGRLGGVPVLGDFKHAVEGLHVRP